MLFAHLKRILKLDRLRWRGPNGAKDEFLQLVLCAALTGNAQARSLTLRNGVRPEKR